MRVIYFGHSCFLVEASGIRLVLDPWLGNNPHRAVDPALVPCDYVLCSHAHEDHTWDALNLARLHGATIVAPYELAEHFAAQGAKTLDLMPGGGVDLPWGRIQMTPAIHSSALEMPNGENRAMGVASGFLLRAAGRSLYHAGDTALFGDMALIGRHGLDLALIPIGDRYTMPRFKSIPMPLPLALPLPVTPCACCPLAKRSNLGPRPITLNNQPIAGKSRTSDCEASLHNLRCQSGFHFARLLARAGEKGFLSR